MLSILRYSIVALLFIQCTKVVKLAMKGSHEDEKNRFLEIKQNVEEHEDCLLCFITLSETQLLQTTYCKHAYDSKCLAQAIVHYPTVKYCPYCKRDLTGNIIKKAARDKIQISATTLLVYWFVSYLSSAIICTLLLLCGLAPYY